MPNEDLWAPWRLQYIKGLATTVPGDNPPGSACFLCEAITHEPHSPASVQRFVLVNDDRGLLLLNAYPYTNGHLLVAPRSHAGSLSDLSPGERAGLIELTALAERLLQAALNNQGANVGINLGRCAGAGLPGHLHVHIVPRWHGDTNFMSVVGNIRVIPQALQDTYDHLTKTLAAMEKP